jgi:5-methylcytosine-specific restriction endonuclease McrA
MGLTRRPVLVLNASYEPINICAVRRALVLLIKGIATLEEADEIMIYPDMQLPLVIRLIAYRRVPKHQQTLSRKNILIRDNHTCQYCGEKDSAGNLTLDHVQPRSRDGIDSWENLVTACKPCNHLKANKTPEEAKMPLLRKPRAATFYTHRNARCAGGAQKRWDKYLFN